MYFMKEITPQTTIHELLETFPFLVDFLAGYNPKFGLLRNAAMRATMGRVATLDKVAGIGEIPVDKLMQDLAARIAQETGTAPGIGTGPVSAASEREKIETLKGIIRSLHGGKAAESAREEFTRLLGQVQPNEIAAMEQELIREGMPVSEIHKLCDLHVNVFRESLETHEEVHAPPGHPIHTYLLENKEIMRRTDRFTELCRTLPEAPDTDATGKLRDALNAMAAVETHYTRKENQLFPYLEKHGFTGPSKVMWGIHDDVRRMLKELRTAVEKKDWATMLKTGAEAAHAITEMIYKEEKILLPTAQRMLTEEEWRLIRSGDDEIGYVVKPEDNWPVSAPDEAGSATLDTSGLLPLDTGVLTLKQLNRMLVSMPVEFSFVDENDEVRYYSGHDERIFPRSPAVIGRKVQNCHPQKSVHMVNAILEAFRAGTRNVAEFWIPFQGKFLHISYYAVRDEDGRYLGTLEVTQDISKLQQLKGEKRLLDWD